jgi:hypothetical protein
MNRMVMLLVAVIVVLLLVIGESTAGVVLSVRNGTNIQALLLNGKTASAISSKKTAREVSLLLTQQAFDHTQTRKQLQAQETGNKVIAQAIAKIDAHLDQTIKTAVDDAAARVATEFAAQAAHGR